MTTYEFPLYLSSSSSAGAINKSSDGSTFQVNFNTAINIPAGAKSCTLEINSASIWNTIYNISEERGNNKFTYIDGSGTYNLTLEDGLYDLGQLDDELNREMVNAGLASGLIHLEANHSSQKVVIKFTVAGQRVDFTIANSCKQILGFDARLVPLGGVSTGLQYEDGDNSAQFNLIDHILVHSDVVLNGIPQNGVFRNIIGTIYFSSPPGSQTLYTPINPVRLNTHHLIGSRLKELKLWITDQINQPVNTAGDDWTLILVVRYTM